MRTSLLLALALFAAGAAAQVAPTASELAAYTGLHAAAARGEAAEIARLVKSGADLNERSKDDGETSQRADARSDGHEQQHDATTGQCRVYGRAIERAYPTTSWRGSTTARTKAPEGTGGTTGRSVCAGSETSPGVFAYRPRSSLDGLAASEPGSRDRPEDHSPVRSVGSHLPLRARTNVAATG
jgi:hypothetical protein